MQLVPLNTAQLNSVRQLVSLSYHVFNPSRTNWHCHYLRLCNCNLSPMSTSQQKQNPPTKRKSIINHRNECPSPLSFSSREHSALNPVFTFFLFIIFHPLRRHLSALPFTGWEKNRNCRLLQKIFDKGVIQPRRDYLKRCKMFPKVRWDPP